MLTCTLCGNSFPREQITVIRTVFCTPGRPYRTVKSRTTAWACDTCRDTIPGWLSEPYDSAPGNAKERTG